MTTHTIPSPKAPRPRVKKRWQIFRQGTHTDSAGNRHTYTEADLNEIASSLNAAVYAPPLVKGHPKNDDPAFGRVIGLQVEGDKLYGDVEVDSEVYSEVDQLHWLGVSVALYGRDNPNNPYPGKLSVRHLGLCGAVGAAVKGMESINYAEGDTPDNCYMFDELAGWMVAYPFETVARFLRRLREQTIADKGVDAADLLLPNWQIEQVEESAKQLRQASENATPSTNPLYTEPEMTPDEIAALQAENLRLKKANQQMLAAQTAAAQTAMHAENIAFCEALVAQHKMIPAQVPSQVKLLDDLAKLDPAKDTEWQEQHAQAFSEGAVVQSRFEAEKANLLKLPKLAHLEAMFSEGVNTKNADGNDKVNPLIVRAELMNKKK